jgi:hypothetical protein
MWYVKWMRNETFRLNLLSHNVFRPRCRCKVTSVFVFYHKDRRISAQWRWWWRTHECKKYLTSLTLLCDCYFAWSQTYEYYKEKRIYFLQVSRLSLLASFSYFKNKKRLMRPLYCLSVYPAPSVLVYNGHNFLRFWGLWYHLAVFLSIPIIFVMMLIRSIFCVCVLLNCLGFYAVYVL